MRHGHLMGQVSLHVKNPYRQVAVATFLINPRVFPFGIGCINEHIMLTQFPGLSFADSSFVDDGEIDNLLLHGGDLLSRKTEAHGPREDVKDIDAEVGDDLIVVSDNPGYLERRVKTLENVLDLRISRKDTSINSGMGNFAEGLVYIPRKSGQTWLAAKSIGSGRNFGFIDVPKVRLLLPVRATRMTWSYTDVGKFSDFGSFSKWIGDDNPYIAATVVAGIIQDIELGATGKGTCVYMPTDFGGGGKMVPLSPRNFGRFLGSWKTGVYTRTIVSVMRQTNRYMSSVKLGMNPKTPALLEHFTKWDPFFTDWIKDEKSILVGRHDIPEYLNKFRVGTLEFGSSDYEATNRLLSVGHIVSETQLSIALRNNALALALVSRDKYTDFVSAQTLLREEQKERAKVLGESLNIRELQEEIKLFGSDFVMESDYARFADNTVNTRNIRRMIQREGVYSREAVDEIYLRGPMVLKRGFYARPNMFSMENKPLIEGRWATQKDVPNTEEDQQILELYQWYMGSKDPDKMPRYLLEDDPVIMQEASLAKEKWFIVTTDDRRLCAAIYKRTGKMVLRFPVEYHYRLEYFSEGKQPVIELVSAKLRHLGEPKVIDDEGSIQSGEERYFHSGMLYPAGIQPGILDHGKPWNQTIKVILPEELDFSEVDKPPTGFPAQFCYDKRNGR